MESQRSQGTFGSLETREPRGLVAGPSRGGVDDTNLTKTFRRGCGPSLWLTRRACESRGTAYTFPSAGDRDLMRYSVFLIQLFRRGRVESARVI